MLNEMKSRVSGRRPHTIFLMGWLMMTCAVFAQEQTIQIRENQTSHLIFPADILYTDIGDNENYIIAYTNNILRVKGVKNQKRTNLTVLTKDQHYYSFFVNYSDSPRLNYFITPQMAIKVLSTTNNKSPPVTPIYGQTPVSQQAVKKVNLPIRKSNLDKTDFSDLEEKLFHKGAALLGQPNLYDYIGARHGDIQLKVVGIYHSLHNCFIRYQVKNKGAIPYDISYIEFGIRERKRPKKAAIHEKRLNPIFIIKGAERRVLPNRANEFVAVFGKVTVPNDRLFYINMVEAGRNINLNIIFHKLPIKRIN